MPARSSACGAGCKARREESTSPVGADRRVLKESGGSPAEDTLLDKSGNARTTESDVRVAALAMIGCPKVGPDSFDPVQATAPSVVVKTKGVHHGAARTSAGRVRRSVQDLTSL